MTESKDGQVHQLADDLCMEAHRQWSAKQGFPGEVLCRAMVLHGAIALAAVDGAKPVAEALRKLAGDIEDGVQSGVFSSGEPN